MKAFPLFIDQRQLAKRYGINRLTLYELMMCENFPPAVTVVREGHLWRRADINAWLADAINYWQENQS